MDATGKIPPADTALLENFLLLDHGVKCVCRLGSKVCWRAFQQASFAAGRRNQLAPRLGKSAPRGSAWRFARKATNTRWNRVCVSNVLTNSTRFATIQHMGRGSGHNGGREPDPPRQRTRGSGEGARSIRYENYTDAASGIRFVFKRDLVEPELLHIFVRHATSPEEAIETFFAAEPIWNEQHKRFETYSETHGVLWYWIEPRRVVMIISCFRL